LSVHVLATALVRVSPQAYNEVVATYKTPIVGLMEAGLVAAVLYHALNGIRVILIDSWSEGPRHQRLMLWIVGVVFVAVLAAALIALGAHMAEHFLCVRQEGAGAGPRRCCCAATPAPPAWTIRGRRAGGPACRTSRNTRGCSCGCPESCWCSSRSGICS